MKNTRKALLMAALLVACDVKVFASIEWLRDTLPVVKDAPSARGANMPHSIPDITLSAWETNAAEAALANRYQIILINRSLENNWLELTQRWNQYVDEVRTSEVVDQLYRLRVTPPATIAGCSVTDVGNAIDAALDGDTVRLPACDVGWDTTLSKDISAKSLMIVGAGIGQTIIRDNTAGTAMLSLTIGAGESYRLSGMTFAHGTSSSTYCCGAITISGSSTAVRVDHIEWDSLERQSKALNFTGCISGVVDHVEWYTTLAVANGVVSNEYTCGGSLFGDYVWSQPDPAGTSQGIFVEDSIFENLSAGPQVLATVNDVDFGGIMVVRYNQIKNLFVQNHGTTSRTTGNRSGRHMEVYENDFTFTGTFTEAGQAVWIEGGTGVVWGNTLQAGYNNILRLFIDRVALDVGGWGQCNGTSVYDGNESGESGYPCVDQPGRGQGILYSGETPDPVATSAEALSPIYAWDNNVTSVSNGNPTYMVEDRDYYIGTAKPGYTPYTYPHPCTVSSGLPSC